MKHYIDEFSGIYPALLTPFTSDDQICEKTLRQLVRLNLAKGVKGFYVGGSTAEAFMLDINQRKKILEIIVDEVRGRAKIISHVGTIRQSHAIELAKHAEANGADMISSIPPFYYGFSIEDLKKYYFALADSVKLPLLIYHFPASSGVDFSIKTISDLLANDQIAGIKFTSNDFFMMQKIKAAFPESLVFNGYDEMFLCGLAVGANGGIGSTYNFMAEKFISMMNLFLDGKVKEAQHIQYQANAIIEKLCKYGVMPAEKALLELMGVDMGNCLLPFGRIDSNARLELKRIAVENGCIITD